MASFNNHPVSSILRTVGTVARSRRGKRVGIAVLIAVVLIGVFGFFVAPSMIKETAERQVSQQLGRPATIGRIAFNPYLLRLEADDVHIGGREGQDAFVDIGQLVVRVSWTSLVRFAPVIGEIHVVRPRLSFVRYDAQRFNVSDLIDTPSTPSPKSDSAPLHFSVSNILVEDGRIDFDDRLLNDRHVIDQVSLNIPFIATLPSKADIFVEPKLRARIDGSPIALDAETKPFARSFDSSVTIKLDGIDVPRLLSYVPVALPVVVNTGRLSSAMTVNFAMQGDQPTLRLSGSVDLNDAQVTTSANQPLFAAATVHVAATQVEPLAGVLHFADIRIDQPAVSLERDKDGVFNVEKLVGGPAGAAGTSGGPAAKEDDRPLDLVIERFAINDGSLHLTDVSTASPSTLSLKRIATTLDGFSLTGQAPASYTFSTDLESGGTIRAEGSLNLSARQAQTKLSIDSLAVAAAQPFLADVTSARVMDGALSATVQARADWSKTPLDVEVSDSGFALKGVRIALADAKTPALSLADSSVKVSRIGLAARSAEISSIELTGLSLNAMRLADGRIDLTTLAAPQRKPAAHGKAATHSEHRKVQPPPQAEAPAWHYRIDEVNLKDAKATFTDRTTAQPVNLEVAPLNVTLRQIGDDLSKPIPVTLKATLNRKGSLSLSGNLAIEPLKVDVKLDGNRVDVAAFEPYLGSMMNARIASAFLNARGDVAFEMAKRGPRASYTGDVALVDVRVLDRVSSDSFAGWGSLALTGLKAGYDDARGVNVDTARVTFSNFYGHVLLDAQGRLRLQDVIAKESGKGALSPAEEAPAAPAETVAVAAPTRPFRLHVGQLRLQNGRVTYTDNFIRPNYSANLVAIGGTIGAFGTDTAVAAPVDIGARLTANGPIAIKGEVNPLAAQPSLDLTAEAKGIELTNLTAYSTKYAGYPITKGKLNVDLRYQLANDQLSANNHIFIDQFTFGEHVDNDTATQLPVRLAIALLKNAQGQIDVNIPVSGSLSNPEFSIGGIIWQAFLNLLEKAITSPFTLLASAFGDDGEDLGYVEFQPGSADLSEASTQKLDTIVKMLVDKPSVALDLAGRVDPETDMPGLRAAYVQKLIKKQKLGEMAGRGKSIDPASVKIEPAEYSKYLTETYEAADFKKPRNLIGLLKSLPDAEMEKALADHAPIDASSLHQLAQTRAQAVHQYLEGKIDDKRVFVVAPKLDASGIQDKGAPTRVDFTLK